MLIALRVGRLQCTARKKSPGDDAKRTAPAAVIALAIAKREPPHRLARRCLTCAAAPRSNYTIRGAERLLTPNGAQSRKLTWRSQKSDKINAALTIASPPHRVNPSTPLRSKARTQRA
jgi:hypothetical protein